MASSNPVLHRLQQLRPEGAKAFAVLVDPDETPVADAPKLGERARRQGADLMLVGGSLVLGDALDAVVRGLRAGADGLPIVLFPGSARQISPEADAILLLSLISGRNPELLIGQHVQAAMELDRSGLEILPTGYMLIDGGAPTTVSYISNTQPIPRDKPGIAAATALAGEQLGLRLGYLDAGSGARHAIPPSLIRSVRKRTAQPLIVGGGIREPEQASAAAQAGADVVVVGNALESDPGRMRALADAVHQVGPSAAQASPAAAQQGNGGTDAARPDLQPR